MLIADGYVETEIEQSNGDWEDKDAAHVFYTSTNGSAAGEGLWVTGNSLVDGEPFRAEELRPLTDDDGTLPAPTRCSSSPTTATPDRASPAREPARTCRGRRTW